MVDRTVRFDDSLYAEITDAAGEDERSVNGEIVWLLRRGLEVRTADARAVADVIAGALREENGQ